jgi:hypothetical protein
MIGTVELIIIIVVIILLILGLLVAIRVMRR